ncbi:nitrate reductase subunit beta [Thiohalorhabdus denitrificans]|uniref:Respiratory nitrate reductase beta subunit n=1 Tax=Thiohalorhabdus denitrificans TaxID=381306 RepID=A0A1G5F864_9GAMM|nr:nitrate reductase subunit beta [Thiohalorhabdus denitrificans]SCY35070.1 respiratory nitrate reductase beta subunit [Thiohalorhabdus denitrificans]
MRVRAQMMMVMNLDKCIGCHTCSVVCKNTWTNRKGMEYAWFNNVESKPGIGYPKEWENQDKWKGGWTRINGKLELRAGGRGRKLASIFHNPNLPTIDEYYEPYTYDYQNLVDSGYKEATPTARPVSMITEEKMDKVEWGPNWEDDLGGPFEARSKDKNFEGVDKAVYKEFENTFHMYLPRACNHCANPACVASCPSGALYKRDEDGIVLVDQEQCRGWRFCVSGCPYKKVYFNWATGKSEKCIGCYPRVESGMPPACVESCVGRIRSYGVVLYDADRIEEVAATAREEDLYEAQRDLFLDPYDPEVQRAAAEAGIKHEWIEAAQHSPVYKMAVEWRVAFPLHPEFRTLPMIWYVPPLSPVQTQIDQGTLPTEDDGVIPRSEAMRTPVKYLANLFTAGDEGAMKGALDRMIAMRSYHRALNVDGKANTAVLDKVGLTEDQARDMYRYMAIANYEDRFVVPISAREVIHEYDETYAAQGASGFDQAFPEIYVHDD